MEQTPELIRVRLRFRERNGQLVARLPEPLPEEIARGLKQAAACVPWRLAGKRMLLYCGEERYRKWLAQFCGESAVLSLLRERMMRLAHTPAEEKPGWLTLPPEAARYAGITEWAWLGVVTKDCLLLAAETRR